MNVGPERTFEHKIVSIEPTPTERSKRVARNVITSGDCTLMGHATNCIPGLDHNDFMIFFSSIMELYSNQQVFKYISVGVQSVDYVCEVAFHNEVPMLIDGQYLSCGKAIYGNYTFPTLPSNFPGMVASQRGAVFGDPQSDMNVQMIERVTKLRSRKRR